MALARRAWNVGTSNAVALATLPRRHLHESQTPREIRAHSYRAPLRPGSEKKHHGDFQGGKRSPKRLKKTQERHHLSGQLESNVTSTYQERARDGLRKEHDLSICGLSLGGRGM